jgi:chlorobactene glucosyltransferase
MRSVGEGLEESWGWRGLRAAAWTGALVWSGAAALALHERGRMARAIDVAPATEGPLVSIVVPARDEERAIGAAVRSLLAQDYRHLELLVVDDQSSDDTAALARAAVGDDPRGRVIDGAELPRGWVGKSWAAWQGYRAATGDWLLFTDADVIHRPDCLARTLALGRRMDRGVTLVPRIDVGSRAEAVVLPAAFALIATFVAPGPLVRSPRSPTAMAAGGYMLLPRRDYARVGGHRAIRELMVDDVSLAERLKAAGRPLEMVNGTSVARLRMYRGGADLWRGWRKNASFGSANPLRAVVGSSTLALAAVAGPAAAAAGVAGGRRRLAAVGLVGWLAQIAIARINASWVGGRWPDAIAFPAGVAFMAAAALRGAIDRLSGRGALWRGRRYPSAR